jgi:hypothetical protein
MSSSNAVSQPGQPGDILYIDNDYSTPVEKPISKQWFLLAMAVGSLVFWGPGVFGTVGLLHSHGLISLPASMYRLASAIGTIGNTPHHWSLWALSGGGLAIGIGLLIGGRRGYTKNQWASDLRWTSYDFGNLKGITKEST